MALEIWHNPRCSKSRQTLELLRQQGHEPTIIEYLKSPPTPARLNEILAMLGMDPRELMRRKEADYKEQGIDDESLSNDALVAAMIEFPKLIERPVVINGDKAAVGRPPEQVLEIL
ncbi:MAG: arsenate reductase (glutaredoxin) [Gammaproteobacteria bacterium]|nr:MAG: arsenate reductase (glutaredoxin) [Gammaproteobacteria bacterium]RLA15575.1 MAG: arsenate reductase (glutaredoxin) [Gammaproteobacteria bacterium]RLA17449.1 MAG: arsenate reductase (glutaredoxin) [Gammaproteobacteria bacterium]